MKPTVQPLRERDLLLVGERLIAEDEDAVRVHPRPDLIERCPVVRSSQIDGAHLGREVRMQRTKCQCHQFTSARSFSCSVPSASIIASTDRAPAWKIAVALIATP